MSSWKASYTDREGNYVETKGEYKTGASPVQYCGDDQAIAAILVEYNYSMTDLARAFLELKRQRDKLITRRVLLLLDAEFMDV